MDPNKFEAIEWSRPMTVSEVIGFLGHRILSTYWILSQICPEFLIVCDAYNQAIKNGHRVYLDREVWGEF